MVESDNKDYVPSALSEQAPGGGGSPPGSESRPAEAEGGFADERLPQRADLPDEIRWLLAAREGCRAVPLLKARKAAYWVDRALKALGVEV